jgi:hypothetical protein
MKASTRFKYHFKNGVTVKMEGDMSKITRNFDKITNQTWVTRKSRLFKHEVISRI